MPLALRQRRRMLAASLSLILATVLVLLRGARHDWLTGDTKILVAGLPGISRCLDAGRLTNCNHLVVHAPVSKFPLIQTVPAFVLHEFGLRATTIVSGLTTLNALAVVAFLAATARWCYRRAGLPLTVVGLCLLVPGLLVPYTAQSFGEAIAAAVFGATVLTALRADRVSPFLLAAAALATVTKETAAPLVVVFGVAAILVSGAPVQVVRRALVHLGAGVVLGLLANAAFNEFRYGTILNHTYLDEGTATHGAVPINTLGLLIAPNGGIAWFWPGAAVAALLLLVTLARSSITARVRLGAAIGLLGFLGTVLSCATWWDPYGWYAWGPRLLIPGAAATATLALGLIARHDLRRTWLSVTGAVLLGIVSMAVLLPSVAEVFNGGATQSSHIIATWASRPECNSRTRLPQHLDESCTTTEAWRTSEMPLAHAVPRAIRGHETYWLTMVAAGASLALWLGLARSREIESALPPSRDLDARVSEPTPV